VSYSPNNVSVYLRSFAGCMAGMTSSANTDTAATDYTFYGQMADAFAQRVDTAWGVTVPTALELDEFQTVSQSIWQGRSPLPASIATIPGSYTQIAQSVCARVLQGNTQVVAEGIDPNGGGASAAPSPIALIACGLGAFATTFASGPAEVLAAFAPIPFGTTAGQKLYVAASLDSGGQFSPGFADLINTDTSVSVLAAPIEYQNNHDFIMKSAPLVTPLVAGGNYALTGLAVGGEGGQAFRVQTALLL
jgi:hypothetical protein